MGREDQTGRDMREGEKERCYLDDGSAPRHVDSSSFCSNLRHTRSTRVFTKVPARERRNEKCLSAAQRTAQRTAQHPKRYKLRLCVHGAHSTSPSSISTARHPNRKKECCRSEAHFYTRRVVHPLLCPRCVALRSAACSRRCWQRRDSVCLSLCASVLTLT
jgi:hypothetical protein